MAKRTIKAVLLGALAGSFFIAQAIAQSQVGSGYVQGNAGASSGLMTAAPLTSYLDRVFGTTADKTIYRGSGGWVTTTLSTYGRTLIDDADAATARATLGLGTAATQNIGTSGANVPLLNGTNGWSAVNTFTLANSFPVSILSGAAGSFAGLSLGRTAADGYIGVAGNAGDFAPGTVAGDLGIQAKANLWLAANGSGTTKSGIKIDTGGLLTFPQYGTGVLNSSSSGVITSGSVANSNLATMVLNTTKCNATAGTATPTDCTAATMRTNIGVVIGTNVQAWDADLDAFAANSTAGLWAYTGAGTGSARTITGTANEITLTNGAGTAGNPTVSLPNALTFTGKTVTGGTFNGVTIDSTSTLNGATYPAIVAGDILYGSASNVVSKLAKSTSSTRYLSNTGASNIPAWAQVDLSNGVTNQLPIANSCPGSTGASSSTYLRGDCTWSTPAGAGDVVGPGSATADGFAVYSGTTGKLIKNHAATISLTTEASGTLQAAQAPALTGDCTTSAGALATTCTKINGTDQTTAWTAYTPTVTSGGGTLTGTTITVAARYKTLGKTTWISGSIILTNIGSGSPTGLVGVSLPASGPTTANSYGFASGMTATANAAAGFINAGGTKIEFYRYDGSTLWSNGQTVYFAGLYEAQ